MLTQIISQFRHKPLPAVAVVLFAVVISFALGGLQRSNNAELESYENAFDNTPVYVTVTNLYGQMGYDLKIPGWIADIFLGRSVADPQLDGYLKDLEMETRYRLDDPYIKYDLSGITSHKAVSQTDPERGAVVTYFEGYDESFFATDARCCLVPEEFYESEVDHETNQLTVSMTYADPTTYTVITTTRTLTVVGTYRTKGKDLEIFCPYVVVDGALRELGADRKTSNIKGVLKDNSMLEEFKEAAVRWFAEPNPTGEQTPWGRFGNEYYLYAMDIQDEVLERATRNYQISIFINKMSSMLVLAFCTAAGFLIGFLLIRSRKREIGLMRTLGGSNFHIYLGFVAEQLMCLTAGIALGGALMNFNAPKQLALFALVYFVGLSAALIVFLHKNLLSSMKEDA